MNVKPMYVAVLEDGTILPGGATVDSAIKAMEREGVPLDGTQVDDIGSVNEVAMRRNPADGGPTHSFATRLSRAGLPAHLSEEEVMSMSLSEAVARLYPIFQHLRVEELATTGMFIHGKKKTKKKFAGVEVEVEVEEEDTEEEESWGEDAPTNIEVAEGQFLAPTQKVTLPNGKESKGVAQRARVPVNARALAQIRKVIPKWKYDVSFTTVKWVTGRDPNAYATALMGANSKLVKNTVEITSPISRRTYVKGSLIGLNLYPADKLAGEFVLNYPYHPFSQIIRSIQLDKVVPDEVFSLPTGKDAVMEEVPTGLTAVQKKRLFDAFSKWKADPEAPNGRQPHFSTCSGSSDACRSSCLVYTGQNTAALKNDWKKAGCLMALVCDPAAYIRLVVAEVDRNAKNAAKANKPFFVRMNLLSDIPWEHMMPWFFRRYANLPSSLFKEPDTFRTNPRAKKAAAPKVTVKPAVQFYDYTKVWGRDPEKVGVTNYDLTFSYSGEVSNKTFVQKTLYEKKGRAAVVFLGFVLEDGSMVRVTKPQGPAGYGFGLPDATDMFAPAGTPESERMVPVVNADKHDARPLDPPFYMTSGEERVMLSRGPCIAGLVWKAAGGGETMTEEQKKAAKGAIERVGNFITYTEKIEGTGKFKVVDKHGRTFRHNGKKVVGFLITPETPRQSHVGKAGLSLLPGM
jgi:hypothetical protein